MKYTNKVQSDLIGGRLSLGKRVIILEDPAMVRVYQLLTRLGPSDLPVLLLGETGTGKEICAAALHHHSGRREGRYLALNCGALPREFFESELFGHEQGAFTGAVRARVGLLESAAGGTVFLDEIGDLPLEAQIKLLRAIEQRAVLPVGAREERPIDVRFVAATHKDMEAEVRAGRFREDLYFRLNVARVQLPPLRERPTEIAWLAALLQRACAALGRAAITLSPGAMDCLRAYAWPGNVRELQNWMSYLAAVTVDAVLLPEHLPAALRAGPPPAAAPPRARCPLHEVMEATERAQIIKALQAAGGVRVRAAQLLGVPLRTLFHKMARHGLVTPSRATPPR